MSQAVNPVQTGGPVQAGEPVQLANPIDQEQRLRIRTSLDENLFVEAGAGTGKTTALVSRITALIASGQAEMNGLAAITFTDAAAGELRERVRRELEEDARDERRTAEERERCERAAREMELASIQTLHSFALSLLRELPLEAGLPPGFEAVDQVQADLWFQDGWEKWLDQALDSEDLGGKILRALRFGPAAKLLTAGGSDSSQELRPGGAGSFPRIAAS